MPEVKLAQRKYGELRKVKLPKYTFCYTQVVNHYNTMASANRPISRCATFENMLNNLLKWVLSYDLATVQQNI